MSTTAQPTAAPSRRTSPRAASTEVDRQLRRLEVIRWRWWWFSVLTVAALAGVVSLLVLLGLITADAIWRLPAAMRAAGLVFWLVVATGGVGLVVVRLIRRRRTLLATARRLEAAWPELGSDLVNAVQFHAPAVGPDAQPPTSAAFRRAAALAAARRAKRVPLERSGPDWSRRRRFREGMNNGRDLAESLGVLAVVAGLMVAAASTLPGWSTATGRATQPWRFIPAVGSESARHRIDVHDPDLQPQRTTTPWRRVEPTSSTDGSPQEPSREPAGTPASEKPSDGQRAGDLAPQSGESLERFQEKLGELLDQQRRVIEATNNLQKQRVEDFTEQDRRELDRMAAIEDDWARFMEEARSDLSKLPPQDLAGSGLLEEIAEIETQLDMAADALSKNALDVADHWEHIVEENARELQQRMESWLPESPDRERFTMDEAAGGADFPLPELPETLEDLVGELLEDEEDLFDELDDISSSAADPGTTGIGWDVLDGPITSMGAQGATGNRLPNNSEVGGRSGEGRQGKVHGEMVGDTAVGKGGRRTPTRLTPDPLSRGEIDDRSRDPVGGATGGGKRSGQGGEGIEGPVPPDKLQQEMGRLADRQAALRNRAEGIDLRIKVAGPSAVDFERLTQLMAQVEQQLRAGRYRGALAHRDVLLQRLDATHRYLSQTGRHGAERPTVRRDTTSNLPDAVKREMLGGATDPTPSGWEEIHRAYLRRLLRRSGQ